MKPRPPGKALKFLRWFCREEYIEEIEGDLTEVFVKEYESSPFRAKRKFFWGVIKYCRPEFIKRFKTRYESNPADMFRHSLLIAYRNCLRYKSSFIINLIGLSTGLACALLIYLWAHDELNVDKFHEKDGQLYQVMKHNTDVHGIETDEDTPGMLARALLDEMPEVERSVAVFPPAAETLNGILSREDIHVKARSKFADKDFFNIFSYPIVVGDRDQVLNDKYAVVISEALAAKLFQTTDNVIGKIVEWKAERFSGQFQIAGIFQTLPSSSSVEFDIVFTYDFLREKLSSLPDWGSSNVSTYVILRTNADVVRFNDKIVNFVKSKNEASTLALFTRPYSDRYLYGNYENGVLAGGRIEYVRLFSIIAIFIVVIACINFMNLSTAKASRRLKEIGVKKVIGANRKDLFVQYLGESMLLTCLSLILAIVLVYLFLPQFNHLTAKQIAPHPGADLIFSVVGIALVTGFVAGCYPAVYLSRFRPATILKGGSLVSRSATAQLLARKGLVVFQFTVSILLMVSVLVVYLQMRFIQSKNLGYERDNVVIFTAEGKLAETPETFLGEVTRMPGVIKTSYMDGDLTSIHSGTTGLEWEGKRPDQIVDFELLGVGYDFIETLGIEMAEGRPFSRDFRSESSKVIFNEAAIVSMGLTDPVGKTVTVWGEEKQIIGVVKNFHFESLYENVKPFFFRLEPQANNLLVKIKAGTTRETLARLEKFYQEYNGGIPFEYDFLDENYQAHYASEHRVSILCRYFAGIAILISCLGLFGLAAFSAERRVKEIGIRKILGATSAGIVGLLSADFTKMVLFAVVVSIPVSYFISNVWLKNFAYHIDLEWWYFIGAGLLALIIAWLTVAVQTIRAAQINPSNCLRSE